ncbi:hypothetical protein AXF42_Ash000670 [Apostasia shenzhenica]|uniref:Uncharacterized protein n=1 Tax=Apostasia shenzhenica TaxID=1088818 RepID=A0A2I0AH42_9ASPA|nr:hypothetical protein AXF42_Ash000670 [Apostasia shenzhenica]
MASNSRLLLPFFLFTAMVAIAAAQPPGIRIATPAERQHLTDYLESVIRRLNSMQPERLVNIGVVHADFQCTDLGDRYKRPLD